MLDFSLREETYDSMPVIGSAIVNVKKYVNSDNKSLKAYNEWYKYKGKPHYFKCYYVFEELFSRELARVFELKCVDFFLGYNESVDNIGIFSKNFRSFDKNYYFYNSFFEAIDEEKPFDIVELYSFLKSDERFKKLLKIYSLIAFDFFSGQTDRVNCNVVIEEENGNFSLSPLTDNGSLLFHEDYIYQSVFGDLCLNKKIDSFDYEFTLYALKRIALLYNNFVKCLDVDIKSLIKLTCDKYGLLLSDYNTKRIINSFDVRKKEIEKGLVLCKKK